MDVPADVITRIYKFMYLSLTPDEFKALKEVLPGFRDTDPEHENAPTNLNRIEAMLEVALTPADVEEFKGREKWV